MAEDKGEREGDEKEKCDCTALHVASAWSSVTPLGPSYSSSHPSTGTRQALPLSISRLCVLFALGLLRAVLGRVHSFFDVSFPWIREEGEGFATRGLAVGRAPSPTGSLRALEPASFRTDLPLQAGPAEDGPILLASGICFRSPVINPMTFHCAISLCLLGD